jgi:RHS repeat-associated protein
MNTAISGGYAAINPFRFSSKPFDAETGLGYWGHRYYGSRLGRWISRDPIAELGGPNSLAFSANYPTGAIDPIGLDVTLANSYQCADFKVSEYVYKDWFGNVCGREICRVPNDSTSEQAQNDAAIKAAERFRPSYDTGLDVAAGIVSTPYRIGEGIGNLVSNPDAAIQSAKGQFNSTQQGALEAGMSEGDAEGLGLLYTTLVLIGADNAYSLAEGKNAAGVPLTAKEVGNGIGDIGATVLGMKGLSKCGAAAISGESAAGVGAAGASVASKVKLGVPKAGENLFVGTYRESYAANRACGSNLTHSPHHAVQNAVSCTSHAEGATINLPKSIHTRTRTFRRNADLGNNIRNLAADIRDLRNLLREAGYNRTFVNQQLQKLIELNREIGNVK